MFQVWELMDNGYIDDVIEVSNVDVGFVLNGIKSI